MAKAVIIDELHLTLRIPNDLPDEGAKAIHQTLAGGDFMNRIRRAIREVIRAVPELSAVRLSLTR